MPPPNIAVESDIAAPRADGTRAVVEKEVASVVRTCAWIRPAEVKVELVGCSGDVATKLNRWGIQPQGGITRSGIRECFSKVDPLVGLQVNICGCQLPAQGGRVQKCCPRHQRCSGCDFEHSRVEQPFAIAACDSRSCDAQVVPHDNLCRRCLNETAVTDKWGARVQSTSDFDSVVTHAAEQQDLTSFTC